MLGKVELRASGLRCAPIGFGCASLGSRVAPNAGLRALAKAHDAGLDWFDVAPAYGAGEAEAILGRFSQGRRDRMIICSKVGLAPPKRNGTMRFVYSVARPVAGMAKSLRKRFRGISATRNQRLELTPEIVRSSLDNSLQRLGTDYIDVFALHDPLSDDVRREDICAALEDAVTAGKVRFLSCAGSLDAAHTALAGPTPFRFAQIANPPGAESPLATLRKAYGDQFDAIAHSVLGIGGTAETLSLAIANDPKRATRFADAGFAGSPDKMATALLLRRALTVNTSDLVLLSLFGKGHLEEALTAADDPLGADILADIDEAFAAAKA